MAERKTLSTLARVTTRIRKDTEERERLILVALEEGHEPQTIAAAADVTRGRIYQVRDKARRAAS